MCGLARDRGAGLRADADEGVVERVQDQRGHGDAVEHARGGGAVVVVVGAGKAVVERGDALVEVAQGVDAVGAGGVVDAGKEGGLAAEAFEQRAQKSALVEAVGRQVQGVGGGPRSIAGDTPTTARSCGGAFAPSSPASFSTRLPPML